MAHIAAVLFESICHRYWPVEDIKQPLMQYLPDSLHLSYITNASLYDLKRDKGPAGLDKHTVCTALEASSWCLGRTEHEVNGSPVAQELSVHGFDGSV